MILTDVVDAETRSRMMAGIRGKNTKPEIFVRRYLHALGYRFRVHRKDLPGSPDIVLPKHRVVIFVHGCFWHRHLGCYYSRMPKTREAFWEDKLGKNVIRDQVHTIKLCTLGWRVLIVWECGLKHQHNDLSAISRMISSSQAPVETWPFVPPRPS